MDKRFLRIETSYAYVEQFPSQALAKVIRQKTLIANSNTRVQYSGITMNLFKKIRSYIVIHGTLNLIVTLVCVLRMGAVDYGECEYGGCDYGECDCGGCVSVRVWPLG